MHFSQSRVRFSSPTIVLSFHFRKIQKLKVSEKHVGYSNLTLNFKIGNLLLEFFRLYLSLKFMSGNEKKL